MRTRLLALALAALPLAIAGCGAGTAFSPLGASPMGVSALAASLGAPVQLGDLTDAADLIYDRPDGNNPFASPITCFSESRPLVNGGPSAPVIELVARADDKPRQGYGVLAVDQDSGTFQTDKKGTLAPHVRVSFEWGDNTSALVAGTSIEAMMVFVIQQRLSGQNTLDRAIGYAWTSSSLSGVYPSPNTPALRINYNGEEIPLRVLPLETGDGFGQPCSTAAFQQMPLKTETITDIVSDYYTCYPSKFNDLDTTASDGGDQATELRRILDLTAAAPPPTSNQDLLGIEAIGFGADVAPSACSHAVFANITMQREGR